MIKQNKRKTEQKRTASGLDRALLSQAKNTNIEYYRVSFPNLEEQMSYRLKANSFRFAKFLYDTMDDLTNHTGEDFQHPYGVTLHNFECILSNTYFSQNERGRLRYNLYFDENDTDDARNSRLKRGIKALEDALLIVGKRIVYVADKSKYITVYKMRQPHSAEDKLFVDWGFLDMIDERAEFIKRLKDNTNMVTNQLNIKTEDVREDGHFSPEKWRDQIIDRFKLQENINKDLYDKLKKQEDINKDLYDKLEKQLFINNDLCDKLEAQINVNEDLCNRLKKQEAEIERMKQIMNAVGVELIKM